MYLSRVILDDQKRETMRLLSSPEFLHGAVEQSFPGEKQRRLWRLDGYGGQCCLLVLSAQKPDFTQTVSEYGFPDRSPAWETKPYEALLNKLREGQTWRFRLKANPVRSVKEDKTGRGKVMAHVTTSQQKEWLMKRAQDCGFSLDPDGFDVVHTQWLRFHKGRGHEITLRTATFEGLLNVRDPEALKAALLQGIGRAKAYGCGLMTLIPPHPRHHG